MSRAAGSTRPSHAAGSTVVALRKGPSSFACACALSCTSSTVRCSGAPAAMDQRPASAHAAHSRASTAPTWLHQPQHSPQASRLSHLRRAHPCHICTGTGLATTTSAPGLGSSLPHLHRDWARPALAAGKPALTSLMTLIFRSWSGGLQPLCLNTHGRAHTHRPLRLHPHTHTHRAHTHTHTHRAPEVPRIPRHG